MKYAHHKYTYEPRFSARHTWSLIGPKGGVHFHASQYKDTEWSCGLEYHSYTGHEAPSQLRCWLLDAPCWHDGTSLYAQETLWPLVKPMLKDHQHDTIFRILEQEADRYFDDPAS